MQPDGDPVAFWPPSGRYAMRFPIPYETWTVAALMQRMGARWTLGQTMHDVFVTACKTGHMGILHRLLSLEPPDHIDVNVRYSFGFTLACSHGVTRVVRLLLSLEGVHRVRTIRTGFDVACANGHVHVVEEILATPGKRRVNVHAGNGACLRHAAEGGGVEVVRVLLAHQSSRRPFKREACDAAFRAACSRGRVGVMRELLAVSGPGAVSQEACEKAYQKALEKNRFSVVEELLRVDGPRRVSSERSVQLSMVGETKPEMCCDMWARVVPDDIVEALRYRERGAVARCARALQRDATWATRRDMMLLRRVVWGGGGGDGAAAARRGGGVARPKRARGKGRSGGRKGGAASAKAAQT